MKSQPQNPEFRNNVENFNPCIKHRHTKHLRIDSSGRLLLKTGSFQSFRTITVYI